MSVQVASSRRSLTEFSMPEDTVCGEHSLDDLKGVRLVGAGFFGTVLLVKAKSTNEPYALKIMSKEHMIKQKVQGLAKNEAFILNSVQSPFINKLHQTFQDTRNVYLLLDYVPGGDLFTLITRNSILLEDNNAQQFYIACIIQAFEVLHQANFVYRDLKPENVLVDAQGFAQLVDFGMSKRVRGRTYTPCGTAEYFSPELITGKGYAKGNDVWGLGILLYELQASCNPFARLGEDQLSTLKRILHDPLSFTSLQHNEASNKFISSVLEKDESVRAGCGEAGISELKQHPWFEGFSWEDLMSKEMEAPWIPELLDELDTTHFDSFDECSPNVPAYLLP